MFQTVRNKFIIFLILTVTITLALIGIISDYTIQKYITRGVIQSFSEDLQHETAKVESFITGIKADIDLLSGDATYNPVSAVDARKENETDKRRLQMENKFIKYMEVKRIYQQIIYIDNTGREVIRTYFDGEKAEIATKNKIHDKDHGAFADTMKLNKGMVYISPFSLQIKNGRTGVKREPLIRFAGPVFSASGEKTGILAVDVPGENLLNLFNNINSSGLMLVNRDGHLFIQPGEGIELGADAAGDGGERLQNYYPEQAAKILAGGYGNADTGKGWVTTWLYWIYNPGDKLLVYQSLFPNSMDKNNYWVLIKSGTKKELIGSLMTIRVVMIGISLLFFTVTYPVIVFFGLRVTRSVARLKKAMDGFERGEGIDSLNIKAKDEFGDLTRSFVTMAESLYSTKMNLNVEFQRLNSLVKFSRLVGEEISEKECYSILIKFLIKNFHFDKVIVVNFNNSENVAEVLISYEDNNNEPLPGDSSRYDLKVIQDPRLCRALRSGHKFVVGDVESDYRCQYQEVEQDEGSYACFPVITGGAVLGWVHLANFSKNYFSEDVCFTIESYINTIAPSINSIRLINAHRKMSVVDPLTGLYNRRFLEEMLERQISIAERYKQTLSVIMADIDHFKRINDTHGHAFGDNALKLISEIILMNVRDSDTVARYGGEEFIIVLPNTELDFACLLAEKIRKAIEQLDIINNTGVKERVTISFGVSSYPSIAYTLKELIDSSDSALYQSKAKGRNMVTKALKNMGMEYRDKSSTSPIFFKNN
ncbi:MAG: diguanylate cyclase [Nitrospirae bacterium]|nr:diguanylate cyclase [Nitrospirota bacterium]